MFGQQSPHSGFSRAHQANEIKIVLLAHGGIVMDDGLGDRCAKLAMEWGE